MNKRDCFCLHSWFHFFLAFLAQNLIYAVNIWFKFMFGSFFQQDHLLNLFISGVYAKRWPKCPYVFQYKNWCNPKSDQWFFFLTLTVRWPFHRKDFKWRKIWGYGVNFWKKTEVLSVELKGTLMQIWKFQYIFRFI